MPSNLLTTSLLLATAFSFMERTLLELKNCCSTKFAGIIVIIDRTNIEYTESKKPTSSGNLGAMGVFLKNALETAPENPIVVSRSVLMTLIEWNKKKGFKWYLESLKKKFIIKEIEEFCIILPINWKNLYFKNGLSDLVNGTQAEKNGLTCKDISFESVEKNPVIFSSMAFTKIISQIFSTKLDNERAPDRLDVQWMVAAFGHGLSNSFIIDLPVEEFKDFTDFMSKKISTKIFLYLTCFGGGINRERGSKVYGVIPKESTAFNSGLSQSIKLTYPYIIVNCSSGESYSYALGTYELGMLFEKLNYFFSGKKYNDISSIYRILRACNIMPDISNEYFLNNMPLIKMPNADYFSTVPESVFNKGDIINITGVKAQTNLADLEIPKNNRVIFISTVDPNAIYTKEKPYTINFGLNFSAIPGKDIIPRIIFSNVKNTIYKFKNIDAPSFTFKDFCSLFLPLGDSSPYTLFFDSIKLKDESLGNCILTIMNIQGYKNYIFRLARVDEYGNNYLYKTISCNFTELFKFRPVFSEEAISRQADFYFIPGEEFWVRINKKNTPGDLEPKAVCSLFNAEFVRKDDKKNGFVCKVPDSNKGKLKLSNIRFTPEGNIFTINPVNKNFFILSKNQLQNGSKNQKEICSAMASSLDNNFQRYKLSDEYNAKDQANGSFLLQSAQYPGHFACWAQLETENITHFTPYY